MAAQMQGQGLDKQMNYEAKLDPMMGHGSEVEDRDDDARRARRKRLWIVVAFVLAATILGGFLLTRGEETVPFAPDDNPTAQTVTVLQAARGSVEGFINATGTLAARRAMPVGVVGEGGRVIGINVEAGDWVNAGQTLVVIDRSVQSQQAQSSAAQIEVARADANLAQANLDRALLLVDRGFISKADVDRLTATRDAATARVRVAEAQYRELVARNARLNIVAPAAGYVLERNVEMGQVVGSGSGALFSIARGGEMELLARLGESDLARLSVGTAAEVVPVGTQKAFTGQIWQISPVVSEQNRQGTARIALPFDRELRPGGFASVRINSGTVVAPILPESAIMSDDEGSYVFVVGNDNTVARRAVTLGQVTPEGIVIDQGLNGSERVVQRAGGFLAPGDEVRPVLQKTGA
jgi:RND family efflux transporter MFP subunit